MATRATAIPSCHHPSKVSRTVDKTILAWTRLAIFLYLKHLRRPKKLPMPLRVR